MLGSLHQVALPGLIFTAQFCHSRSRSRWLGSYGNPMKDLLGTIGDLLEKLATLKTLWFAVPVAALVSLFLLFYNNGRLSGIGGCTEGLDDTLGLCTFIETNLQLISLIAVITIIMFIVMVAGWAIKKIRGELFVESEPEEEEEED